jgi:hypothetical protein
LVYCLIIYGDDLENPEMDKFMVVMIEFYGICDLIIYMFEKLEEIAALKSNWEPEVERIEPSLNINEVVILILKEVFYRGYGSYYFNQKCEKIVNWCVTDKRDAREYEKAMNELDEWKSIWYGKHKTAIREALSLIDNIEAAIEKEDKIVEYKDDEEKPEVEVWRFGIPIAPWWRIIFEQKRMAIDMEKQSKLVEVGKESPANEFVSKSEVTSIAPVNHAQIKCSKVETVVMLGRDDIKVENVKKRNISVKPKVVDDQTEVPLPVLVKDEEGYKLESQNELYKNLFLKVDEDDPVIKKCNDYGTVKKKVSKEEKMEEECCHGDAMGQLEDVVDKEMLSGDKSLKSFLIKERNKTQEDIRETAKKKEFHKNKETLENFFRTNIEEMMENNRKLTDAREKYKLQKMNYFCSKELCYEMDPFVWELVKCKDGTTKVNIVQEDDKYKNWEKMKVLEEEDIVKIRNFETLQDETDEEENEEDLEDKNMVELQTFDARREAIEMFFKNNIAVLRNSRIVVLRVEKESEIIHKRMVERGIKIELRSWKFFRCTNGKLKIIEKTSITEDGDPELEKKRVAYWGQRNDVTFVRKKIAVKESFTREG